jgi:chromosome partitioning protein
LARIIAVTNQKGGVGKTTTAINLSAFLASKGLKILLLDCDPQANATASLGFKRDPDRLSLYSVLVLSESPVSVVQKTPVETLDLLPSDKNLVGATIELVDAADREFRLKNVLISLRASYDFIIIDCPPSLDLLTLNALTASDAVLIPIQCEYLALEGVSELLDTVTRIRGNLNPNLEIEGVVLTMYDDRTTLSHQVVAELRSYFGSQVFQTVIPRNVRLAEAPSHGKPILLYDPLSKGAVAYSRLAEEVIANDQKRPGKGPERTDPAT